MDKDTYARNRLPMSGRQVGPGDRVFVDLRAFGIDWYDTPTLP
jgi:hypothetical protein